MTATVVVLVESGVDDIGAVENVMGKPGNDVSDVALTEDVLGGVIAIRNKVMVTLKIRIASVATVFLSIQLLNFLFSLLTLPAIFCAIIQGLVARKKYMSEAMSVVKLPSY